MAKTNKLASAKKLEKKQSPRLAVNHNETVLRG
jgi:hypothetical protein